jgi:hypothetical protein
VKTSLGALGHYSWAVNKFHRHASRQTRRGERRAGAEFSRVSEKQSVVRHFQIFIVLRHQCRAVGVVHMKTIKTRQTL